MAQADKDKKEEQKSENPVKQLELKFGNLKAYIFNACAVGNKLSQPVRADLVGEPKGITFEQETIPNFAMLRQQIDEQTPPFFDITDEASKNNFLAFIELKARLNYLRIACLQNINILERLSVDDADGPLKEKTKAFESQVFTAFTAIQKFLRESRQDFEKRKHFHTNAEVNGGIGTFNSQYAILIREELSQKSFKGSTPQEVEFAKEYCGQLSRAFEDAVRYCENPSAYQWSGGKLIQAGVQDKKPSAGDDGVGAFQKFVQDRLSEISRISNSIASSQESGGLEANKLERFKQDIRDCLNEAAKEYETCLEKVSNSGAQQLSHIKIKLIYSDFRQKANECLAKLDVGADKNNAKEPQIGYADTPIGFHALRKPGRLSASSNGQGLSINSLDPQAVPKDQGSSAQAPRK